MARGRGDAHAGTADPANYDYDADGDVDADDVQILGEQGADAGLSGGQSPGDSDSGSPSGGSSSGSEGGGSGSAGGSSSAPVDSTQPGGSREDVVDDGFLGTGLDRTTALAIAAVVAGVVMFS